MILLRLMKSLKRKDNEIKEKNERRLSVKVLGLSEQTKKKDASSLFEVIADEQISL